MSSSSRPRKPQSTLDAFISSRKNPISEPVFTSRELHDRGSVFVANIYHANTQQEAKARVDQMKALVHSAKPATHEMSAWRCMVPKPGRSGLGGPEDFELQSGSKDDGERWAGGKILNVMETLAVAEITPEQHQALFEALKTLHGAGSRELQQASARVMCSLSCQTWSTRHLIALTAAVLSLLQPGERASNRLALKGLNELTNSITADQCRLLWDASSDQILQLAGKHLPVRIACDTRWRIGWQDEHYGSCDV